MTLRPSSASSLTSKTFEVRFESQVLKQLRKIDPPSQARILKAAKVLATNPIPPAAKRLVGYDHLWRVRLGDYRIVYTFDDVQLIVLVVQLGHRRDVYRL